MKKSDADTRALALSVLQNVLRRKQALDESLARQEGLSVLERRDRAFVHALVAVSLRRLGQIDAVLAKFLNKPHEVKPQAQDILRLGAAQILFLGTPPHAAVDTSVALAAQPHKGLVNAVLRRLAREGAALIKEQDEARLNTPRWLWDKWRDAYGEAQTRQIALAHLAEAPTDISVKGNASLWAEKLGAALLPTGSARLPIGAVVTELEGFAEGSFWVQDVAAALPALLCGEVEGRDVFDLCAAPGGKAMQLACRGARVTAVDRSAKRLDRMKENIQRLKLDIEIYCADALSWAPPRKADAVLLDAPCTATGTARRHPDVLRLKEPEDVARMTDLQERLLDRAARDLLAPGGTIVYAVCSLQPEEGEAQIEKFLSGHSGFSRLPVRAEEVGGLTELVSSKGDLRCLPCHLAAFGGMDGFFAARVKKVR